MVLRMRTGHAPAGASMQNCHRTPMPTVLSLNLAASERWVLGKVAAMESMITISPHPGRQCSPRLADIALATFTLIRRRNAHEIVLLLDVPRLWPNAQPIA